MIKERKTDNYIYISDSLLHRICIFTIVKEKPVVNLRFLDASVVDEGTQPKDDVEAKEDKPGD